MSSRLVRLSIIGCTILFVVGAIIFMEASSKTNIPVGTGASVSAPSGAVEASESGSLEKNEQSLVSSQETNVDKEGKQMNAKTYSSQPSMTIDAKKTYTARLTTSAGTMTFRLYPSDAPVAVNNFVFLAREGFYANTVFHRIISGFMIQGGDPTGTGMGGPGYRFNDEPVTREYTRGTIAMANAGPNTNGSQFFVMHADYPLPKQYVIFGSIDPSDAESLKTLDMLAATPVVESGGERSKPVIPPVIADIRIEEK